MSWLDNIRQSDNRTKFRYVAIFSGIVGIFAVAIWAISVRGVLERLNNPVPVEQQPDTSFKSTIIDAWGGLKDRTKNTFEYFKEKAETENEIIIEKE